jgi:hypothetical protein
MFSIRKLGAAIALGLALTATDPSLTAYAAKPKAPVEEVIEATLTGRKNPKKMGFGAAAGKILNKATALGDEEKYAEAIVLLDQAFGKSKTPYEKAKVSQIKASYFYFSDDYENAAKSAMEAIKLDGLSNVEHLQTKLFLAQIYNAADKLPEAIAAFNDYAADAPKVKGSDYILQASNHYNQENFKEAIVFADKALASGDKVENSWLQIKMNSLYQGENYEGAIAYGKELMAKDPTNKQWLSLVVSSYLSLDNYADSLSLLNEAKAKGMLDSEALWTQLYQLYANSEKYVEASAALEEGISKGFIKPQAKHYLSMGQYLVTAAQEVEGKPEAKGLGERAITALKKSIEMDTASGEAGMWLGQFYLLDLDQPKAARDVLAAAVTKTLAKPGNAYYLLGVAEEGVNNRAAAKAALLKAQGYPESKTNATNYLKNFK